jgi:putative acetyltransferase
MYQVLRTNSAHPDFIALVQMLDAYLAELDGKEHHFYAAYNTIASLQHCVVIYQHEKAIGCGAFKPFDDTTVEIKRMFILPEYRGRGVATQVLISLEQWAAELGISYTVLETGKRMPEAIALYTKNGYDLTENYGQYAGVENSVCFRKALI